MSKEQRQLIAFWSFFFSLKIWRYSCLVFVFFLKKIFHSHHVFEKQWSITRPLFILPSEGLVMTILSFSYGNGYQTGCGIFIDNAASALRAAVATSIISYPTRSLNNCWLYKVYLLLVFLFRIFILHCFFFLFFFSWLHIKYNIYAQNLHARKALPSLTFTFEFSSCSPDFHL